MTDIIGESTVLRSSIPANAHPTIQQVKSSGFVGAGLATVVGLLTTMTFTAEGPSVPSCTVNGTLTFPGPDCWDVRAYLDGALWAYWPGINAGQTTEYDASGNGHHLTTLTTTTITERLDGTGTNWANLHGYSTVGSDRVPAALTQYYHVNSDIRLGVFTDSHYSADGSFGANQSTNIPAIIGNFDRVGVDVILMLGDMYNGDDWTSDAEMQTDVDTFEGWLDATDISKIGVSGNHDKVGGGPEDSQDSFWTYSTHITKNRTLDIGDYRIISFHNSASPFYRADDATLIWLTDELSAARIAGKKILLATHCLINQNFPGVPATWNEDPHAAGTVTPSATTGSGITVTASVASFSADSVGETMTAKHGTVWGVAIIASYVNPTVVTVNITQNFASTAASDAWGIGGYSMYAYNAAEIRAIINAAIDAGADIRAVLQGHIHTTTVDSNVDGKGVNYYTFKASSAQQNGFVIDIISGELTITADADAGPDGGIENLGYPTQYPGPLRCDLPVVAINGPELWTNPTPQVVDAANYTSFDAETKHSRVVSSGTFVQLAQAAVTTPGKTYEILCTSISNNGGQLKLVTPSINIVLGVPLQYMATVLSVGIARVPGACDITFICSVREVMEAGDTYPDLAVTAPLGSKFQAITEWTNNAAVDLSTLTATANTRLGTRGIAIWNPGLDATGIIRADRVLKP